MMTRPQLYWAVFARLEGEEGVPREEPRAIGA